jgi:F-type H+-transporting ATPase subunit gamma
MRLAEIQSHIGSVSELLDIVGAMRSLAGMRVQEAQRALPGIRSYAGSMAAAIGTALLLMPETPPTAARPGRRALILCTAEHGFVGGFNERLIESAAAALAPADALFVLGSRGAALAIERGWRNKVWTQPMASRPAGVAETIDRLAAALYARIARGEIARVEMMFGRYRQGGAPAIERLALLPLDTAALAAAAPRQPPLHNLAPEALLERLAAEYLFARLTEASVESIASENAARFAAMESAHDNVAKKLEELRQQERQARQSDITAELLDLITGTEVLTGDQA